MGRRPPSNVTATSDCTEAAWDHMKCMLHVARLLTQKK